MKKGLLIISVLAVFTASCIKDRFTGQPEPSSEQEVEIVISGGKAQHTRAQSEGTPDERAVETLDLLVFDGTGGFKLWRSAYKVDSRFRATLPVSSGLNVYFVANCRGIVTALAGQLTAEMTWEKVREKLLDDDPERFVVKSGFESLPMWGRLLGQTVEDVPVNKWKAVSLIRSVASVDIYIDPRTENFGLEEAYLYFVPDKGLLAPSAANYDHTAQAVTGPESPEGMKTSLTLHSGRYDAVNRCIANKLYLYENDTRVGDQTILPNTDRRYTRVVIGGIYEGNKYYYPLDFETSGGDPERVTRNWKYVFTVNSVSSRGYEDPETASTQPMVGIDLDIVQWNVDSESDFWVSGPYYLGLERKTAFLTRNAGSTDALPARSNILSDNITLEFKTADNGPATSDDNGIANSRFRVEKIKSDSGYLTGLRVTALGQYDKADATANNDVIVLTSGRIRVEIAIVQQSGDSVDWIDGGDIGEEGGTVLGGNDRK